MSDPKNTLGIQHKNYLNLKINPEKPWQGSIGQDAHGHTIFISPDWGLRAAILNVRTYWFTYRLKTIISILSRWAPADDTIGSVEGNPKNDPLVYAKFVSERMKFDRNANLELFRPDKTLDNVENLHGLIKAMAEMENYNGFTFPDSEFKAAVEHVRTGETAPSDKDTPNAVDDASGVAAKPSAVNPRVGGSSNLLADLNDDLRARLTKLTALDLLRLLAASGQLTAAATQPDVRRAQSVMVGGVSTAPSYTTVKSPEPGAALTGNGFKLTAHVLERLMAINSFPRKQEDQMIFFGLRGCLPASLSSSSFAEGRILKVTALNYINPRCTIGQWKLADNTVVVFPGSTIPAIRYVEKSVLKGGADTNQLLPGYYQFIKAQHRPKSEFGHPAFVQDGSRIYLRTADNTAYEPTDITDTGNPGDDLHAAFGKGLGDLYSSAGCQVVMGFPDCAGGYVDTPPWPVFRQNAYDLGQSVFSYILLDAAEVATVAENPDTPRLLRLRCGSHQNALPKFPELIKSVQTALIREGFLKSEPDGSFGAESTLAALEYQKKTFGAMHADGIVGGATAAELNILDWPVV
jgi:hypothetical protein